MGLINLPSLIQKIKVDTSDMKKAEGEATKFGTTLKASNKDAEGSYKTLSETQKDFTASTAKMSEQIKTSTKSFTEQTKAVEDFNKKQRQSRKDTDDAGDSFASFAKRVEGTGKSFGALSFNIKDLKIPALAAGLGAGVGALAALGAAAGAVVAQFGPMVGVFGAIAPIQLAMKTSTMLLKDAFTILSDKKTMDPFIKNLQKIKETGAKAAVVEIKKGFDDLGPIVKTVGKEYEKFGAELGKAVAGQAKALSEIPGLQRDIGTIFKTNTQLATTFAQAVTPLVNIFKNLVLAASPMAQRFAEDFVAGAEAVSASSNNVEKLTGFFDKAEKVFRRTIGSFVDIGKAIKNTFTIGAQSVGIDFVGGLESGARKMKEFTESVDGQNKIKKFFEDAGPVIRELGLLLKDLTKDLLAFGGNEELAPFIKQLRTEVLPAFNDLAQGAGKDLLPVIGNLLTAFADFNGVLAFSPLIAMVDSMAKLTSAAAGLIGQVPGLGSLVATLLLVKTTSKGLAIASNFSGLTSLVTNLKGIGPAGAAGAKGMAGFVQGLRGASGESKTFANSLGTGISSGFSKVKEGAKAAVTAMGAGLKSAAVAAGGWFKTLGANAKAAGVSMLTTLKAGIASAITGLKTMAANALAAAKSLAATVAASARAGFAALGSALAPVIAGLKGAAAAAKAFTLSLLTNPIFLIIAGIVALGAALVVLYKKNETFRNFVNGAWAGIKAAISATVDWIVNTAWPWLKNAWDNISGAAKDLWNALKDTWNWIKDTVSSAITWVKDFISANVKLWADAFVATWNFIKDTTKTVWDAIYNTIAAVFNTIKGFLQTSWNNIKDIFSTGWNNLKTNFTNGFKFLADIVTTSWNSIKTIFSSAMVAVKTALTAGWELIKLVFKTAFEVIKALVTGNWKEIPTILGGAMDKAKTILSSAWTVIKNATGTAITTLVTLVKGVPSKIVSALGNVGTMLYNAGKKIIQGLIDGIRAMASPLTSGIRSVLGPLAKFLPGSPVKEGPLKVLNRGYAGKQIIKMVQDGIESAPKLNIPNIENLIPTQRLGQSFDAGNFPRPSKVGQSAVPGAVNNSRIYNVTINETNGPSTVTSLTNRLRLIDVAL